jgi:ligand-binding sensor domain-containing protein
MFLSSRWIVLLVILSLISLFLFPSTSYAEASWMKFFRKDALLNTYMRTYAVDGDKLWVGTYGDGVVVYTGAATRNFTIKNTGSKSGVYDGLISDLITCITVHEKEGRVWVGTNQGLSSCNLNAQNWKSYTTKDGLPNDMIRDIVVDTTGAVWVATPSGVARLDTDKWTTFDGSSGLDDANVQALTVRGDSIWAATVGGTVARFNGSSWKTYLRH